MLGQTGEGEQAGAAAPTATMDSASLHGQGGSQGMFLSTVMDNVNLYVNKINVLKLAMDQ